MSFISIELLMKLIPSEKSLVKCSLLPNTVHHVIHKGSTETVYFSVALLITILYR